MILEKPLPFHPLLEFVLDEKNFSVQNNNCEKIDLTLSKKVIGDNVFDISDEENIDGKKEEEKEKIISLKEPIIKEEEIIKKDLGKNKRKPMNIKEYLIQKNISFDDKRIINILI